MSQQSLNGSANNTKIQSFLEALRASRGNSPKTDNPEQKGPNPFLEFQAKKESEQRRIELFHQARQQEWNQVYSSKNKEHSQRIETLRRQLADLAKQVKRLDINIAKAVDTPVQDAGAYQESFLNHIESVIQIFRLQVNSANSWLEVYSGRSKKKSHYWQMAKSKGSSFTQANERNVATSVG